MSAVSMPAPPVDLTPGRPALLADSGTLSGAAWPGGDAIPAR